MKLILLRCPNCSFALKPEEIDVIHPCPNCQSPVLIGEDGLSIVTIQYATPDERAAERESWVPFWTFFGSVKIVERETQGMRGSSVSDSQALWGQPRRLFVPAWDLSVHQAQDVGSNLIQRQPPMHFVDPPAESRLAPAVISQTDALNMLEFIILAIEARRKDWLKNLTFDLEVGESELWAIPLAALHFSGAA